MGWAIVLVTIGQKAFCGSLCFGRANGILFFVFDRVLCFN